MENKRSASFGRYLRTVRLEKGIKLSAISGRTRISRDTLELIEEDHTRLPAEVFVKGFIRAYARDVGADGDKAVDGFAESRRQLAEGIRFDTNAARSQSNATGRLLTCLGVLAVGVVLAILALQAVSPSRPKKPVQAVVKTQPAIAPEKAAPVLAPAGAGSQTDRTEPAPPVEPAPAPGPVPAIGPKPDSQSNPKPDPPPETVAVPEVAPRTGQHIRIQVVEDTWLKVIVDSLNTREYSLAPGDILELDAAKGFNLLVGNATGIQLQFNGEPVPVPGKSGQVVTLQLP